MLNNIQQLINNNTYEKVVPLFREALLSKKYLASDLAIIVNNLWQEKAAKESIETAILLAEAYPSDKDMLAIANTILTTTDNLPLLKMICQRYLTFESGSAFAWGRLGNCYFSEGDFTNAELSARKALALEDTDVTRYSLGFMLLHTGNYKEGLALYESRISAHQHLSHLNDSVFPFPRWQGEPLKNKRILLWMEQGFGDVIQALRFLPMLKEQGAEIALIIQDGYKTLKTIVEDMNLVDNIYPVDGKQISISKTYDYHCPTMSLLHGFSINTKNIPDNIPYINATEHNQTIPSDNTKLRVGVVWGTAILNHENAQYDNAKNAKSIELDNISNLFSVENTDFVNLKIPLLSSEKELLQQHDVIDNFDTINNFSDTAKIIAGLDVVISIDTSVAHLAGAMGKPVMLLLPYVADWRWQKNRDDSPWYPTMRLYRQVWKDDWEGVLERVKKTLNRVSVEYQTLNKINIFGG